MRYLLIVSLFTFVGIVFKLGEYIMALKDSIINLQNAANAVAAAAQTLIALAATLKANAVDPADIAAIDAVVVQLQNVQSSLTTAAS